MPGKSPGESCAFCDNSATIRLVDDETMTLWVRLKGEDRERAVEMRAKEKRSYASLMRIALAHYYDSFYASSDDLVESA